MMLNFSDDTQVKMKCTKKKKKVKVKKTKLFTVIETENTEKDFLLGFIKVGTDIAMTKTTYDKRFMSDFAFARRTVLEIDGYKILFERDTPDIGYFRHLSFLNSPHEIEIKKKTKNKILVKVTMNGHITNYELENYV